MSSELMVRDEAAVDLAGMTLDELAQTANYEHRQVETLLSSAVAHAITAGSALLAARERVESGHDGTLLLVGDEDPWFTWLRENVDIHFRTAQQYMRIARYKAQVIEAEYDTVRGALDGLSGLPFATDPWQHRRLPDWVKEDAKRLRSEGLTYAAIAEHLPVSSNTVRRWLDARYDAQCRKASKRHSAKRKAERDALRQRERDQAVKRFGGDVHEAYTAAIKNAERLHQAAEATEDRREAAELREIRDQQYKVRDMLWQYVSTR